MTEVVRDHGINENTPENILFGAGTIHKGLKYNEGSGWNFNETLFGATNGGSKLSIVPEVQEIEVDGKYVKTIGFDKKVGEKATMEINFAEVTKDLMKQIIFAKESEEKVKGYTHLVSKPDIEKGDYIENFAFVGKTVTGKSIIVVFDHALCTSGFETDTKHKSQSTLSVTIECCSDLNGELNTLPYHIYFPEV